VREGKIVAKPVFRRLSQIALAPAARMTQHLLLRRQRQRRIQATAASAVGATLAEEEITQVLVVRAQVPVAAQARPHSREILRRLFKWERNGLRVLVRETKRSMTATRLPSSCAITTMFRT